MYRAPVEEISFTLKHVAGLEAAIHDGLGGELTADLLDAILSEAGRFADAEVAPLAQTGDRQGAAWRDGRVTMPDGWRDLYHRWVEGGWNGLTGPVAHGGQGLPTALSAAVYEMWNGASMAFGIGPTLTLGAVEALETHGTPELRALYLDKLVSGEWMGTMNLTEPQAGSDLSSLRTRAERRDDGTYRLFGSKIFITYGEHDLTDNIVHLVLARLPDAPAGVKGISLFLVPKRLVAPDGTLGARNDVFCHSIEHKLGIHASPTCTMVFGDGVGEMDEAGAVGWLIGEENRGLACMFTMMNSARIYVGIQGLGVAQAAFQKALDFARERRQGRSKTGQSVEMAPIVEHADVARMLLTMKSLVSSARAIAYSCGHALDMAKVVEGADEKRFWSERASLLTPLAKSFPTDVGVEVASLGIQVHGGMGFVEETGAARLLRDARIAPIYEGTNGIQAIDLVTRKLPLSEGRTVEAYIAELEAIAEALSASNRPGFADTAERLREALGALREATRQLLEWVRGGETDRALAGATAYQRLFALTAGNCYLVKGALANEGDAARVALARYMANGLLQEVHALAAEIRDGGDSLESARQALD
ncbi:acyl-CoA dehydrogenase [Aureimonas sp. ME7]|uniref:acyl-CoA dehydrogenase n=1 Tax=Aureimonas sp. ME7 TaxID=2744252 RepID=UPI0015F6BB8E|nr:acyl-CoA dehydrogenase [Aureimonas sp. ME7]